MTLKSYVSYKYQAVYIKYIEVCGAEYETFHFTVYVSIFKSSMILLCQIQWHVFSHYTRKKSCVAYTPVNRFEQVCKFLHPP